ncbi:MULTISPECIES: acyl-CoA carboxylase epsilon subunit [unclassified Streptomyces]|uniref:acyl-CoA carboxylase epsilon subunit n=1 Tax=unclassified Streptomyces TaxID=2593676 RepID=UPI00225807D4|nr:MULTISPECIES: acyl-CoA carboxylase epsilon subunit [unclassified Streptomyces]MCX5338453.1 acyl-CoA carboxylase epsilon subunit [Streptomyces sp. NBC_00140]MCX5367459.1 acyl-CoA carboxylase epsilon subunit [Streptomyces sp. NBC_00124]
MGNGKPMLRVERGQADAEELAALAVVLLALQGAGEEQPETSRRGGSGCSGGWRSPGVYKAPGSWR